MKGVSSRTIPAHHLHLKESSECFSFQDEGRLGVHEKSLEILIREYSLTLNDSEGIVLAYRAHQLHHFLVEEDFLFDLP